MDFQAVGLDAAEALASNAFNGYNKPDVDLKDPWQFKNFLVTNGG